MGPSLVASKRRLLLCDVRMVMRCLGVLISVDSLVTIIKVLVAGECWKGIVIIWGTFLGLVDKRDYQNTKLFYALLVCIFR